MFNEWSCLWSTFPALHLYRWCRSHLQMMKLELLLLIGFLSSIVLSLASNVWSRLFECWHSLAMYNILWRWYGALKNYVWENWDWTYRIFKKCMNIAKYVCQKNSVSQINPNCVYIQHGRIVVSTLYVHANMKVCRNFID